MSEARGLGLLCPRCRGALAAGSPVRCSSCDAVYASQDGILSLVAGATAAPGYDPHYFGSLREAEETHFWFLARREAILQALEQTLPDLRERPLFDIGCGTGGLLAFLTASGVPVAGGCDAYAEGLRVARRRVDVPLVLVDEGRLPPLGPGQALIGLFDVLEHIDDDRGTLAWIASVLEPGGAVVLTVPAHPFLFDEMDAIAHHRRRYRRPELREKLEAAGLQVLLLTHLMAPLVPLVLASRWLGARFGLGGRSPRDRWERQLSIVPGLNGVLRAVLRVERLVLRSLSLPLGSSLLAVAIRPSGGDEAPVPSGGVDVSSRRP